MKKIISFLLMLCLILTMTGSVFADGNTQIYASAFAAGDDDWFGRGCQVYHTTEATLKAEGRTADWNSPGRYFDLTGGCEYTVSVEILQNDAEQANFIISLERPDATGTTGWERLVIGNGVKKGEWTTVKDTFTAGNYDSYLLYVETEGSPNLSYEIRNFTLTAPAGAPTPKPTEAPAEVKEVALEDLPSLKEAYAGKFDFGAAAPSSAFMDPKLMKLMYSQFSILTPENELKPDSVLDVSRSKKMVADTGDETSVAVRFDAAKQLLRFAQRNGLKVHGHVLVWHSQTPEAFFHEGYDANKPFVTREVMLGRLENYIKTVLTTTEEEYPGVIVSWDVVNEAIDDGTNWIRKTSRWTKVIGEDFINYAFEYARKYAAEGVLLYYNDYNSAMSGKMNGIIKMIRPLIEAGTIDGYGFQMHHTTGSPSNQEMARSVKKIADLGLKMRVSELDIGMSKYTETGLKAQADKYKAMMELMLQYADQTEAVQVWGLTDNMSWRSSNYPLLFDRSLNPKPAFYACIEAAQESK